MGIKHDYKALAAQNPVSPPKHFESIGGYEQAATLYGLIHGMKLWDYQRLYERDQHNENKWFWHVQYYDTLKTAEDQHGS